MSWLLNLLFNLMFGKPEDYPPTLSTTPIEYCARCSRPRSSRFHNSWNGYGHKFEPRENC